MLGRGDLIGVTGGGGQIGRLFCQDALRLGYRLRCFGRNLEQLPVKAERVALDLAAAEPIDPELLRGCRAVVHLAAHIPSDHKSLVEAERCWQVNVRGTARLVQALAAAGVDRFIQLSSASAYAIWSGRTDENAPLFPKSRTFYLSSKIAQELVAAELCHDHDIATADLRVSSVYGGAEDTSIIARFAAKLLAGEPIELNDEGRFGADFVLAADVAAAISMVLGDGTLGTLNVASGTRTTLQEIAAELQRLTRAPPELVRLKPALAKPDPGFPAIRTDNARALGFTATPIGEGLAYVVAALRRKADGNAHR